MGRRTADRSVLPGCSLQLCAPRGAARAVYNECTYNMIYVLNLHEDVSGYLENEFTASLIQLYTGSSRRSI